MMVSIRVVKLKQQNQYVPVIIMHGAIVVLHLLGAIVQLVLIPVKVVMKHVGIHRKK